MRESTGLLRSAFLLTTSVRLFLHTERVTEEMRVYLNASCGGPLCVRLKSYDAILDHLKEYVSSRTGVKVWIGTEYTNYALFEVIKPEVQYATYITVFFVTYLHHKQNGQNYLDTREKKCEECFSAKLNLRGQHDFTLA